MVLLIIVVLVVGSLMLVISLLVLIGLTLLRICLLLKLIAACSTVHSFGLQGKTLFDFLEIVLSASGPLAFQESQTLVSLLNHGLGGVFRVVEFNCILGVAHLVLIGIMPWLNLLVLH